MKLYTVPTGLASMGKCSTKGPKKVVEALNNFYLNESLVKTQFDIENIKCDSNNLQKTNESIYKTIKSCDEPFIAVGGDHSITYSIFKAVQEKRRKNDKKDMGIIVLDAHADLMDNFNPPTHEDYLRVLIEEGLVDAKQVILIGVRNIDEEEAKYLKKKKIRYFSMDHIFKTGLDNLADGLTELLNAWKGGFYLSIDIDVCDPAFAPGTGYCEPGGLSSRELIYLVQRLKKCKTLVSTDVVEVNPDLDLRDLTSHLAAKIVKELV